MAGLELSPPPHPGAGVHGGRLATAALLLQVLWGIFFAGWNFRGLALVAQRQAPLGPGSSMNTALLAIGLIVALMVSARRSRAVYAAAATGLLVFAGWVLVGEITADVSQWASEGSRVIAVGLNGLGILGALLGLAAAAQPPRPA
jgi:hypothetical protein